MESPSTAYDWNAERRLITRLYAFYSIERKGSKPRFQEAHTQRAEKPLGRDLRTGVPDVIIIRPLFPPIKDWGLEEKGSWFNSIYGLSFLRACTEGLSTTR